MHFIDIFIVVLYLLVMAYGFYKGFISSILTLAGLVASTVLISWYAPQVRAGIMIRFGIGNFLATTLTYLLIIVMIAIVVSLLKMLFNYLANLLKLNLLNRLVGAAFNFLSFTVILVLFLFIVDFMPFLKEFRVHLDENSKIIVECAKLQQRVKFELPPEIQKILDK